LFGKGKLRDKMATKVAGSGDRLLRVETTSHGGMLARRHGAAENELKQWRAPSREKDISHRDAKAQRKREEEKIQASDTAPAVSRISGRSALPAVGSGRLAHCSRGHCRPTLGWGAERRETGDTAERCHQWITAAHAESWLAGCRPDPVPEHRS